MFTGHLVNDLGSKITLQGQLRTIRDTNICRINALFLQNLKITLFANPLADNGRSNNRVTLYLP